LALKANKPVILFNPSQTSRDFFQELSLENLDFVNSICEVLPLLLLMSSKIEETSTKPGHIL
jgi:hypothetical protein